MVTPDITAGPDRSTKFDLAANLRRHKRSGWRSNLLSSAPEILPGAGPSRTHRSIHRPRRAILGILGIRGRPALARARRLVPTSRKNLDLGARRVTTIVNVPVLKTTSAKGNRSRCRRGELRLALLPAAPLTPLPLPASPLHSPRSPVPSEVTSRAMIRKIDLKPPGIDLCLRKGEDHTQPIRETPSCATS